MVLDDIDQNKWSLGLDRVNKALDRMDHPERGYRHILVGGTNGKGSTCVYLEQILIAAGYRVGTTMSPHIRYFNERFRINSSCPEEKELEELRSELQPVFYDIDLTYFEWCVVLAAMLFARHKVDVGIFEIGLGGRFDASNVMDPVVSVITNISLDHTNYLGHTIAAIAGEKAAIARPGRPLVTTATGEGLEVIRDHAEKIGADLHVVHDPYIHHTSINGPVQGMNAALAIKAAASFGVTLDRQTLSEALDKAFLPGRIEHVGDGIILDVAHNQASMLVLVTYLENIGFDGVGVLGVLADKDYMSMTRLLKKVCSHIYIAPLETERSWGEKEMSACAALGGITRCSSTTDAYHRARQTGKPLVITGSFHTVGELRDTIICTGR